MLRRSELPKAGPISQAQQSEQVFFLGSTLPNGFSPACPGRVEFFCPQRFVVAPACRSSPESATVAALPLGPLPSPVRCRRRLRCASAVLRRLSGLRVPQPVFRRLAGLAPLVGAFATGLVNGPRAAPVSPSVGLGAPASGLPRRLAFPPPNGGIWSPRAGPLPLPAAPAACRGPPVPAGIPAPSPLLRRGRLRGAGLPAGSRASEPRPRPELGVTAPAAETGQAAPLAAGAIVSPAQVCAGPVSVFRSLPDGIAASPVAAFGIARAVAHLRSRPSGSAFRAAPVSRSAQAASAVPGLLRLLAPARLRLRAALAARFAPR